MIFDLPETQHPKVSIIVVNYNGLSSLGKLFHDNLSSLLTMDYPNFEIILVDNASKDGSVEYVEKTFGNRVRVLKLSENYWYPNAVNKGLKIMSKDSKYVMIMNNDVVVTKDCLKNLVTIMEKDEKIGVASPKVLNFDGSLQWMATFINRFLITYNLATVPLKNIFLIPAPCGPAYIVRKDCFGKGILFDQKLIIGMEETWIAHLAWLKGYKVVYVPSAIIYHKFSGTIGKYPVRSFILFHNYKNELHLLFKFGSMVTIVGGIILRMLRLIRLLAGCARRLKPRKDIVIHLKCFIPALYWLHKNRHNIVRYRGGKMFYFPSDHSFLLTICPSLFPRLFPKLLMKFQRMSLRAG